MRHTIGVVISTQGRDTLIATLDSIKAQGLEAGDRIIVVGDGVYASTALGSLDSLVRSYGSQFAFVMRPADPGAWGHTHVNWGFDQLHNTVDRICGQDDDDIFAPRAFDVIREWSAKHPDSLLMTRVYNWCFGLLWKRPEWGVPLFDDMYGSHLAKSGIAAIDGHCPFIPGHAPILPKLNREYEGDQMFVLRCSLLFMNNTQWVDIVSTITRPDVVFKWRLQPELVDTPEKAEVLRTIRNSCKDGLTNHPEDISPEEQQVWFKQLELPQRVWLLKHNDKYIAFAVFRPYKDGYTATCGVAKEYRGRGYGREVTQFVAIAAQGPLVGEAFSDNIVLPLDYEAGWEKVNDFVLNGRNLTELRMPWPPKLLTTVGFG